MIYLVGHGGFARETAYVLGGRFDGYLTDDENEWGKELPFKRVVGSIDSLAEKYPFPGCVSSAIFFLPAVGSPKLKMELVRRATEKLWHPWCAAISEHTFIGDADIGEGSIVCSMCSITTNVKIGQYVNVNLNCTIGHDVVIEDYVNLSPHCTISGKVHLKRGCDLGSNCVVLPGITVGEYSVLGAGSVITKDVPPYSVVVGVPGKVIKMLKEE